MRPGSGGSCAVIVGYTVLSPRQELTVAPNAAFSLTSGSASNASSLNGQPAIFYTNAANISTGTISDLRLSTNIATNSAAQTFSGVKTFSAAPSFTAAGSPFSVSNSGLVSNLNADLLDGLSSAAFAPASHTHDGAAIISGLLNDARLSTNIPRLASVNAFTAVNSFSSSVGLGTTTPTARLHVRDAANLPSPLTEASVAPFKVTNGTGGGILMDSNQIESVGGPLYFNFRGDGAGNDVSLVAGGGNVGIGTGAPNARLEVVVAPTQSFQFRQDGFVPGINVISEGGNAGIMRLRNAIEIWPSDNAARAGRLDVRNTSGNATITLDGATGNATYANQPAIKSTQTFRDPRNSNGGVIVINNFRDVDALSVNVPVPGFLHITATLTCQFNESGPDPTPTDGYFKLEETTSGSPVMLTEVKGSAWSDLNSFGNDTAGVLTISWTIPANGAGTRSFKTVLTAVGSTGNVQFYTSTLTVMYIPRGM